MKENDNLLINNKTYMLFSKCTYKNSIYLYLINTNIPYDKKIVKYKNNKIQLNVNSNLIKKLTRLLLDSYKLKYDILA